jgi:hypothetical protein
MFAAAALVGCSSVNSPDSSRPAQAQKWLDRAQHEYQEADMDEAHDSVQRALTIVPQDHDVKQLAASIALARLDYAEVLKLLKDVRSADAASLRGRALWYQGELDSAADELEAMLAEPETKDEWAKSIAKLARRGAGRTPFQVSGGLLANIEIVRAGAQLVIIPIEIDGEASLAMLATGTPEVVLDSATRPEPSWVSMRFGGRLEVHDVPALSQDLSGISKQLGAPVKALIGVNLLRHLNATVDLRGQQFVVRSFAPPPPPNATRLPLYYIKGGGMVVRSGFGGGDKGVKASLLVDTALPSPLALDQGGWKKAGIDIASLQAVKEDPTQKLRVGVVPILRIGAFDIQQVPAEYGMMPIDEIEKTLGMDIDGVIGSGLLGRFRATIGDEGRMMWLEDDSAIERVLNGGAPRNDVDGPPPAPPGPMGPPVITPAPPPAPTNAPKSPAPAPGSK